MPLVLTRLPSIWKMTWIWNVGLFFFLDCSATAGPSNEFQPIGDYVIHRDVCVSKKSVIGCDCSDTLTISTTKPCWNNRFNSCCAVKSGQIVPYDKNKKLMAPLGYPIYECNSA